MTIKLTDWEIQIIESLVHDRINSVIIEINKAGKQRKLQEQEQKHAYYLELENLLTKLKKS